MINGVLHGFIRGLMGYTPNIVYSWENMGFYDGDLCFETQDDPSTSE